MTILVGVPPSAELLEAVEGTSEGVPSAGGVTSVGGNHLQSHDRVPGSDRHLISWYLYPIGRRHIFLFDNDIHSFIKRHGTSFVKYPEIPRGHFSNNAWHMFATGLLWPRNPIPIKRSSKGGDGSSTSKYESILHPTFNLLFGLFRIRPIELHFVDSFVNANLPRH
jgi:hypothetical protein